MQPSGHIRILRESDDSWDSSALLDLLEDLLKICPIRDVDAFKARLKDADIGYRPTSG